MQAVKAVQQHYIPNVDLLNMLEQFRQMLNACIRIGLAENVTSLKLLSTKAYHQLAIYDVMSCYKLCAISAAAGILRNYRKAKRRKPKAKVPYARKRRLVTCYGFKIKDGCLLLPYKPHQPVTIPLNQHTISVLAGFNARSVTLTANVLSISYSKETTEIKLAGYLAVDRNLDNVTTADMEGRIMRLDLSEPTEIKAKYREVKRHLVRNDARIRKRISGKCGRKEKDRVQQILHHASKMIVQQAKQNRHGIVLEKLTGIRKLYRKGNGQGSDYRAKMNGWSFAELQRQIEYKACWEGLPVIYVKPQGTSSKYAVCGSRMARIPEERRTLRCQSCGYHVDRDVNAARNILARALRFGADASPTEAMVAEPGRPETRQVDGDELTTEAQQK